LLIVFPIAVFFFWLFPDLESDQERSFNARLKDAVRDGQDVIPLKMLTDFPWNAACYTNSYGMTSDIERNVGITVTVSDYVHWWLYAPDRVYIFNP
jgi:hypothetical protein